MLFLYMENEKKRKNRKKQIDNITGGGYTK